MASRLVGTGSALPSYVSLDRPTTDEFEYEKPHYAGSGHAPFRPFGEVLDDLTPVKSFDRLRDRKALLAALDEMRRKIEQQDSTSGRSPTGLDRFQGRLVAGPLRLDPGLEGRLLGQQSVRFDRAYLD